MRERRVTCPQCLRYDKEARHCLDGKANPKRKSDSVEVAEVLGVQHLCLFNPYRDTIALQMYDPHHPRHFPNGLRSFGRVSVEVEPAEETVQAIEKLTPPTKKRK